MKRKRVLLLSGTSLAILIAYGSLVGGTTRLAAQTSTTRGQSNAPAAKAAQPGAAPAAAGAPSYRVDPLWPQPLPNHWVF